MTPHQSAETSDVVCPDCGAPTEVVKKLRDGLVRLPTCDCLAEQTADEFFARRERRQPDSDGTS